MHTELELFDLVLLWLCPGPSLSDWKPEEVCSHASWLHLAFCLSLGNDLLCRLPPASGQHP